MNKIARRQVGIPPDAPDKPGAFLGDASEIAIGGLSPSKRASLKRQVAELTVIIGFAEMAARTVGEHLENLAEDAADLEANIGHYYSGDESPDAATWSPPDKI